MKVIYASKLYRSSRRKDVIKAALVNSANMGLVQQLADSLDDEYKKEAIPPEKKKKPESNKRTSIRKPSGNSGGSFGGIPKSLSSGLDSESFDPRTDLVPFPEDMESGEGESSDSEASAPSESTAEDVNESTKIKATTFLDSDNLNTLKDGLNLVSDTAGVIRTVVKEGELWIYYNDNINLNNIMTDVIDYIDRLNRGLEFNRLARSDNAIVFEYVLSSSYSSEKETNE